METKSSISVLITKWQSSGLSKKAFCRENNIGYHYFNYWLRKSTVSLSKPGGKFVAVKVVTAEKIDITGRNGFQVTMPFNCKFL